MKRVNVPALGFLLSVVGLWELASRLYWVPVFLFPAPTQVLESLIENQQEFQAAFLQTLSGTLLGFLASLFLGTLVAMVFSLSRRLRQAVLPFAVFFQTIPIIAIAPLLVIYFGFGMPTVIASSFIVSVFPILANTLLGLEGTDPGALDLFRLYSATPLQTLWKLKLPGAYSFIYAGWKVSIGLAIIGAIAGEFVAGGGLGAMIDSARTQQRIDLVFAALILLSLMGLILMSALKLIHLSLQKIRPYGLSLKE